MMTPPAVLTGVLTWWSALYSDHHAVSVTVRFLHLAGLLIGGGTALAADRHLIGAVGQDAARRQAALALAGSSHRIVVPALALMATTGALMAAADLETFLNSRLFWFKMGVVGLLLINGTLLVLAERAAVHDEGDGGWARLRLVSAASLALWIVALLMGTWLTVAA